jgi:hypothetical protein
MIHNHQNTYIHCHSLTGGTVVVGLQMLPRENDIKFMPPLIISWVVYDFNVQTIIMIISLGDLMNAECSQLSIALTCNFSHTE